MLRADGKLVRPRDYAGSLEERAQEAIIVFQEGDETRSAVEDLILKIAVKGNVREFAWIIPLPNVPNGSVESPALFHELFDYCETRRTSVKHAGESKTEAKTAKSVERGVTELKTQLVGDFRISTIREETPGALDDWLLANGYQSLGDDAADVLRFYREKRWCYACIRVSDAALAGDRPVDLRPLRLRFETGGRDGIVFPMKLTGLQTDPFDVNLYVFAQAWLNDDLNAFGYVHRGLTLKFRDFDGPNCVANAGKLYGRPAEDAYLRPYAPRLPETAKFFLANYPGERFYLTNLGIRNLDPRTARAWPDDLWLFPYYTSVGVIPFDARPGGGAERIALDQSIGAGRFGPMAWFLLAAAAMFGILLTAFYIFTRPPKRRMGLDPRDAGTELDEVPPAATG
ncbi:MAG: DUF2330 domain-containing protein [Pirellulales bacterium]